MMLKAFSSFLFVSLSPPVLALYSRGSACNVSSITVEASTLPLQANTTSFIALGVGIQNYTCSAAGTFASAGAVATLFEVSCFHGSDEFATIPDTSFKLWTSASAGTTPGEALKGHKFAHIVLGDHFFITNPLNASVGINPNWDFTAHLKDPEGFVVGARSAGIPATTSPTTNVDWLKLVALQGQGSLANEIYRVETRGGQPPTSCTTGDSTSVKYTTFYWFTGGKFAKAE